MIAVFLPPSQPPVRLQLKLSECCCDHTSKYTGNIRKKLLKHFEISPHSWSLNFEDSRVLPNLDLKCLWSFESSERQSGQKMQLWCPKKLKKRSETEKETSVLQLLLTTSTGTVATNAPLPFTWDPHRSFSSVVLPTLQQQVDVVWHTLPNIQEDWPRFNCQWRCFKRFYIDVSCLVDNLYIFV